MKIEIGRYVLMAEKQLKGKYVPFCKLRYREFEYDDNIIYGFAIFGIFFGLLISLD